LILLSVRVKVKQTTINLTIANPEIYFLPISYSIPLISYNVLLFTPHAPPTADSPMFMITITFILYLTPLLFCVW